MQERLLNILKCPECGGTDLALSVAERNAGGEIITGTITCAGDGREYPVIDGIPRMLSSLSGLQDTQEKFDVQWDIWGESDVVFGRDLEQSQQFILDQAGFGIDADHFAGKVVLDAGCGHGMFVQNFSDMGCDLVVGIDLCETIGMARKRNAGRANVELIQADLLKLPIRDGVFDYVFCNGVATFTPDPKGVVGNLIRSTKIGGHVNLWVYPKGGLLWEVSQKLVRTITSRLPARLLAALTYLAVPLLLVVPTYSGTSPLRNTWSECAQVIFDWLSPRLQTHHDADEVVGWYSEFGCDAVELGQLALTVTGLRAR